MSVLDPLTGSCPYCHALIGQPCVKPDGTETSPHKDRLGVVRGGITQEVRRYSMLIGDEVSKLHSGAINRDDLAAAHKRALQRFDYGESIPD